MSIYGLAEPGWLQAVVSDCISDKFERLTHVLVIGPSIVQYFLKEDCRFSILYETIVFNEIAEWIYILGYKTFIDKKNSTFQSLISI